MKKLFTIIFIGFVVVGCSKTPFSPKMKGVGFWESPNEAAKLLDSSRLSGPNTNCFTTFVSLPFAGPAGNEFQISRVSGMGLPELIFQRLEGKKNTLVRTKDITAVEWVDIDPTHAQGAFEFDAFYGNGRITFRATKKGREWVINYMAVPRKNLPDDENPHVVFDLSDSEVNKLCQPIK